jgi:DNA adenine methylase
MGGKSHLVSTITPIIHNTPHECYCEPFCGAAWILFGKDPAASECEVINDADGDITNFFRILQNHPVPFVDLFKNAIVSRQIFKWEQAKRPETLTDLQRAASFYYLQRLAFGGKPGTKRVFGYATTCKPKLDISSIPESIADFHHRLADVTIENEDGLDCIRRYDRPHTLFFVDPPYCEVEGYPVDFSKERYAELAALLAGIKGKFILTLNNHPHIRETFATFQCREAKTMYSLGNAKRCTPVTELMFSNFKLPAIKEGK